MIFKSGAHCLVVGSAHRFFSYLDWLFAGTSLGKAACFGEWCWQRVLRLRWFRLWLNFGFPHIIGILQVVALTTFWPPRRNAKKEAGSCI